MSSNISRRRFLERHLRRLNCSTFIGTWKSMGYKAPSDKLNIAAVGIGGMGNSNLNALQSENIVGLCDGTEI